jgi:hypothetical protein
VVVIPGQGGREQNDAFRNLITNNNKLSGIIHVVDFGYTQPRSDMTEMQFISSGIDTIEKLRTQFLEKEIEYFKGLSSVIQRSGGNVKWLHLVLNKVDLYPQSLHDAINHYSEGEFGELVKSLKISLGMDFNVEMSIIISSRDNVYFNGQQVLSIVDEKMNEERLLTSFLKDLSIRFKK